MNHRSKRGRRSGTSTECRHCSGVEFLSWSLGRRRSIEPPLRKVRLGQVLWAAFLCIGISGCAGYHLGPTNGLAAGEKSIQVNPFINQTLQPRLTDAVTSQVRKELQRDGTYKLATSGDADIIVSGSLTTYLRTEVTFATTDILTVRDYRLMLTARVAARERSTGKEILNQAVNGYTLIRVGADLPSAERQAMPLLAADLAKNITALLAEGKW